MSYRKIAKDEAVKRNGLGVDFTVYNTGVEGANFVVEETKVGHLEEFVHDKSTFIYLILEGFGTFILDDEKIEVTAGDALVIEPSTRIHFFGELKQILITTPAYDREFERHIRDVDLSESPYVTEGDAS